MLFYKVKDCSYPITYLSKILYFYMLLSLFSVVVSLGLVAVILLTLFLCS